MRLFRALPVLVAGAMMFLSATQASAAIVATPFNNAGLALKEWNLVSFNNYKASNETEGRVYIGGDLTSITNGQVNFKGTTSSYGTSAVTVFGDAKDGTLKPYNGGITVGGNLTVGSMDLQGSGTIKVGGSANNYNGTVQKNLATTDPTFTATMNSQRTDLINSLTSLSSNLAALANTGTATFADGSMTYAATNAFNVITVDMSQLAGAQNGLNISSPDGKTTIINVTGTSGTLNNNLAGTSYAKNVIWNFYQASTLTLGGWEGAVLAAGAKVDKDNRGALNGTLVASELVGQTAELHSYGFQGDLSSVGSTTSAMPEPGTWAMLILGFGMVGAILRRRPAPLVAAHA